MTIEICPRCKGYGFITIDVGSHKSEYETETCSQCLGSGRIEMESIYREAPFKSGESERYHRNVL